MLIFVVLRSLVHSGLTRVCKFKVVDNSGLPCSLKVHACGLTSFLEPEAAFRGLSHLSSPSECSGTLLRGQSELYQVVGQVRVRS